MNAIINFYSQNKFVPQYPIDTTDLKLWFRSDFGTSISGGKVVDWNAYYTTISTTKATPTNVSPSSFDLGTTLNGIQSIRKNGQLTENLDFNNDVVMTNYTIFTILRTNSDYAETFLRLANGGYLGSALTPGFGGPGVFIFSGGVMRALGGQNLTTAQCIVYQSGSGISKVRQNFTEVNSTTNEDPSKRFTNIFTQLNDASTIKQVWEIIFYDRILNTTEIQAVETYLKNRYAL